MTNLVLVIGSRLDHTDAPSGRFGVVHNDGWLDEVVGAASLGGEVITVDWLTVGPPGFGTNLPRHRHGAVGDHLHATVAHRGESLSRVAYDFPATTVTAYQRVFGFLKELGLGSTEEIVVLLVDRSGVIRWSALGELTTYETVESLGSAVRGLTAQS